MASDFFGLFGELLFLEFLLMSGTGDVDLVLVGDSGGAFLLFAVVRPLSLVAAVLVYLAKRVWV